MPIEVKHGVAAGPVAAAAFGGGVGRARARAAIGGAAAISRNELAREGRKQQLVRDDLAHKRGLERMSHNTQLQQQAAEGAQERRRSDLEFGYTTKQNFELDRLANAEANALSSSDFTDDEKKEIRRKVAQQRAGIQPVERPRKLTTREKFDAGTYTDPKTGNIYPIDANGGFGRPIHEPPTRQPTYADRIKAVQNATNAALGADGRWDQGRFDAVMKAMGFDGYGESSLAQAFEGQLDQTGQQGQTAYDQAALEAQRASGLAMEQARGTLGQLDPSSMAIEDLMAAGQAPYMETGPREVQDLDTKLSQLTEAKPVTGVLEPENVNDLNTMRFQLQGAREREEGLRVQLLDEKRDPTVSILPMRRQHKLQMEQRAARKRVAALEAREKALREKAEWLQARRHIRLTKLRAQQQASAGQAPPDYSDLAKHTVASGSSPVPQAAARKPAAKPKLKREIGRTQAGAERELDRVYAERKLERGGNFPKEQLEVDRALVKRIGAMAGEDRTEEEHQALLAARRRVKAAKRRAKAGKRRANFDTDGDGRVSARENKAGREALLRDARRPRRSTK